MRKPSVVASVVATGSQVRSDPAGSNPLRHPLPSEGVARRGPRQEVNAVTDNSRLTHLWPTPTGLIHGVRQRLDALEQDLAAARTALAEAEAELTATHRRSTAEPVALTTVQVAELLGLSRSTVTLMISRQELPSVKVGG
jgi:hypothetical protein